MRRALTLLMLLTVSLTHAPAPQSDPAEGRVRKALMAGNPLLQRVEIHAIPARPDLFVAICDTETKWWGTFECVRVANGRIQWKANIVGAEPDEQSIHRLRAIRLPGFTNPLVEVFGMTHMGNGNFYLYELQGRTLRCLLTTFAVDGHRGDHSVFRGGVLDVEYRDLDGDGVADVTFSGIVDEFDEDTVGDRPVRSTPCRKVFRWRAGEHRFVEDLTQRRGFEMYPGRE